ncbi:uncharacterized protein LOC121598722 [Anopheles merus]|uniref:uncharacterized protein LOC121598722 n=1 Tax=Anopheles merus TaxID=30066 RepID=UPI001BE441ED|nr:uncharacterized protein LOC121598722 [Anopheles merus]
MKLNPLIVKHCSIELELHTKYMISDKGSRQLRRPLDLPWQLRCPGGRQCVTHAVAHTKRARLSVCRAPGRVSIGLELSAGALGAAGARLPHVSFCTGTVLQHKQGKRFPL